jgi:hypothetical protein
LISASSDGSIFFLRIKEHINGSDEANNGGIASYNTGKNSLSGGANKMVMSKIVNVYNLNDFCLFSADDRKKTLREITEYESEIESKKTDIEDTKEQIQSDKGKQMTELERTNN